MPNADFPQWFTDQQVEDSAFAAAYDFMAAPQRAWIKKTVALAAEMAGRTSPVAGRGQTRTERETTLGLLVADGRALERVVALVDQHTGPSRLAAALTPALLAGVRCVAAVLIGEGDWTPACLTALELTGVELAATLDDADLARLFQELAPGQDALLDLRSPCEPSADSVSLPPGIRCWRPDFSCVLHVWCPASHDRSTIHDETCADHDLLQLLHGAANVLLWGPGAQEASGMTTDAIIPDFTQHVTGAVLAPVDTAEKLARSHTPPRLLLTPATAGCWAWPDLPLDFFRCSSLACLPDNLL